VPTGYGSKRKDIPGKPITQSLEFKVGKHQLSGDNLETLEHIHHIFELYSPQTGYASNLKTVDFTNGNTNGNFETVLTTTDEEGTNRIFLASEALFRIVDMERHNLVVPIVGDFAGDKSRRAVAKYLKDHEATVSVFYVSNVDQYFFQNNPGAD